MIFGMRLEEAMKNLLAVCHVWKEEDRTLTTTWSDAEIIASQMPTLGASETTCAQGEGWEKAKTTGIPNPRAGARTAVEGSETEN